MRKSDFHRCLLKRSAWKNHCKLNVKTKSTPLLHLFSPPPPFAHSPSPSRAGGWSSGLVGDWWRAGATSIGLDGSELGDVGSRVEDGGSGGGGTLVFGIGALDYRIRRGARQARAALATPSARDSVRMTAGAAAAPLDCMVVPSVAGCGARPWDLIQRTVGAALMVSGDDDGVIGCGIWPG